MAKLPNLWLKGGSQKLGGVVLYQANGQTLARELAPSVSNPRTDSQMMQRVKLANVVAVYRANRGWMRNAFEDKKQTESDYNAFVSANLANSLIATSKTQATAGAAVVAPYKVSSGSLPVVEQSVSMSEIISNLYLGNYSISPTSTVGELTQALLANNNGLSEGMQLSVIINMQQANQDSGIPYIVVRAYECILSLTDSRLLSVFFPGSFLSSAGTSNNALTLDMTEYGSGAATFMLSQTTGGKTRVSTQYLTPYGTNTYYAEYTSASAWNNAVTSYGVNTTNFLDSRTAQAGSSSEIQNYITGLICNSVYYRNGQTVYGGFTASEAVILFLNDLAPEGATVSVVMTNKLTEEVIPTNSPTIADTRQRVFFYITSGFTANVLTPLLITLTINDQVMQFTINVDDGDIS